MISVSPVLSLSDTGSHPHNAGDWISKNDFISLFPQIFHGKQISLRFKADILVGDSTVILVPLRLIDWSFAVCFVSWICRRVIFSFFIRQLIFHQMNPFTLADCRCGAIQQVLFRAEDNKGSICVGFHELCSSAASGGWWQEVRRLDYVLSIFTHSAVNNSDN